MLQKVRMRRNMNEWIVWALGLGIPALVIVVAYYSMPHLKKWGAYQAVRPYLLAAIAEAWKASDHAVAVGLERLEGYKKKQLADYLYTKLPQQIVWKGITIRLTDYITPKMWREWVQSTYDWLMKQMKDAREDMHADYEGWVGTL